MSRIFIDRPIFAWVIAIITMLVGAISLYTLPVEQFPDIAPPQVNIRANYPGASAATLETSVTQVIEQQLTGIDGLLYFSSTSTARGSVSISATFEKGTDPDIAQVQVQNKVQQALSRLPQQVQQQGITVTKSNPDFLMIVGMQDTTDRTTNVDVADYIATNLQDAIGRVEGVGETQMFGSQYAMRIWLDPARLAAASLNPGDVISAIQTQNAEVTAGEVGGTPAPPGQMLNATITAQSRLQTPEQFAKIVVKTLPDGSIVSLRDVARIELGAENYGTTSRLNGHPGAGMSVSLSPGADALSTAERVKAEVERRSADFPPGYVADFPQDTTIFIEKSIDDVVKTLFEAVILVVIVIFVFLQSWRATLIPAIAVPVVLLGTFGFMALAGFTINTLTLFGMVLAIGLLVDDAIVVVENVERLMAENPGMTPREATIESMREISVALVAIALVLSAVFLPMAFFGGSTGVIYRQFSLTIVVAMALSVAVALILSPALTSTLLKRHEDENTDGFVGRNSARMRVWFERNFGKLVAWYHVRAMHVVERKRLSLGVFAGIVVVMGLLFWRLPTGFLPNEDQGMVQLQFQLPAGATIDRTREAQLAIEKTLLETEGKNIDALMVIAGGGGGAAGQNSGRGYMALVDWDNRPGAENVADAIARRATQALSGLRDVEFFATVPAAVRGLGQSSGFSGELLNSGGLPREEFQKVQQDIVEAARKDPTLANVRLSSLPDQPTLKIDIDSQKLAVLGLTQNDVSTTLSAAWGGRYVNDFIDRGRVKRVYVQGDAQYRAKPEDMAQWQVRGSSGQMVPFSAFSTISWDVAPTSLSRFNGVSNYSLNGQAAPGASSGDAMNAVQKIVDGYDGVSLDWSGVSYQERLSSGQAPLLYLLSIIVIFLCLAALYESWTVPVAVLFVIPLGLIGAILAVSLRGLQNDVYMQIGLLTTMGLAAKNAILMIEFAEQEVKKGKRIIDAALEAARVRLRPILMTSAAFIFGVLPLAIASGAGANSRIAIGTAVIGGMLTATVLAVLYIPLFFVMVRRVTRDGMSGFRKKYDAPSGEVQP
ncbi:multidrug efflux RND transporter permease subunit [Novosphingobium sp. MW5]|nr:multidrug efflux RND transporter permease subunit [Novosphingobium sp. MW5]